MTSEQGTSISSSVDGGNTKKITWTIKNYSKAVKQNMLSSRPVTLEGFKWQMTLHPKPADGHLSFYLRVVGPAPPGWFVYGQTVFKLIHHHKPNNSFTREAHATFNRHFPSFGYDSFVSIDKLQNKQLGFLSNDTCVFEIELTLTTAKEKISCINNQQPAAHGDYLLHLETMNAIHAEARSFLKSSSSSSSSADDDNVKKLLKDAVKAEEGIIAQISKLRNRNAREEAAATKEAKELIDQSLVSAIDGFQDARCELKLASLCTDFDECLNVHKGATCLVGAGGNDQKLDALTKKSKDELDVARKEMEALIGRRVEASKRTHRLYVKITSVKVVEMRSKPKTTSWRNLISSFKRSIHHPRGGDYTAIN